MANRFTAEWDQVGEILTGAERQLIDIFASVIASAILISGSPLRDGPWEVDMSELDTKRGARGVGAYIR